MRIVGTALLLGLLPGCHSGEKACRTYRDTYRDKLVECGFATPEEADALWKDILASRGACKCDDVDDLRAPNQFWEDCMPTVRSWTCEQVAEAELPPSCHDQLIVYDPPC